MNPARAYCSAHEVVGNCVVAFTSAAVFSIAYMSIAGMLGWMVYKHRRFLPYHPIFLVFIGMILFLGSNTLSMLVFGTTLPSFIVGILRFFLPIHFLLVVLWMLFIIPKMSGSIVQAEAESSKYAALAREAADANKAKTDFLAIMSHELRTPLTAVIGFGELLAEEVGGELNSVQKDSVRRIQLAGQHLLGVIDQVLNFAKIESGHISCSTEVVNVCKLCTETVEIMRPMSIDRKLAFSIECSKALFISTDPQKLRQILTNLLHNSIKFTRAGSVVLEIMEVEDNVVFHVVDTGCGIPKEFQNRIFDKFWQVEQGLTRTAGGAGLGLAISKKFVQALGGTIYLHSEVGKGSRFTVVLPTNMPLALSA